MPTYEYECQKCDQHFDAFQLMSAEPYKTCPKELCPCKKWGEGKVKRLIGAGAGLIFKGSGFYITDYRSEGYKSSAKNDAASAGSPPAASEKKSSTSSEAKTPTPPKSGADKKNPPAAKQKKKN